MLLIVRVWPRQQHLEAMIIVNIIVRSLTSPAAMLTYVGFLPCFNEPKECPEENALLIHGSDSLL
jgi:hypothetical protein